MTSKFPLQFFKGNCDGCLQKKTIPCFLEFVIFLFSYEAAPKSMVFFCFKAATDGFPGLWVRPLPGADKRSSQRRRNREYAD